MKIALYSRPEISHRAHELRELFGAFDAEGVGYVVNFAFAETVCRLTGIRIPEEKRYHDWDPVTESAAFAVSYGGDGTFLETVKLLGVHGLPVMGVNSGRLGFLANIHKKNIRTALRCVRNGEYTKENRHLLEITGELHPEPEQRYAFNEFSLQRAGTGMIAVEVFVDSEMVGRYWGDGVMLSTPAGSTAYSLSVGGPIVAPECGCFIISPIAPHNLSMRPVIVPDTSEVSFRLSAREGVAFAALDGISSRANDGAVLKLAKSPKSVCVVELSGTSFYDTLRNKMMWGVDRREEEDK